MLCHKAVEQNGDVIAFRKSVQDNEYNQAILEKGFPKRNDVQLISS